MFHLQKTMSTDKKVQDPNTEGLKWIASEKASGYITLAGTLDCVHQSVQIYGSMNLDTQ